MKKYRGFRLSKALLLLTVFALSVCLLVACGGGGDTETDAATNPVTEAAPSETADMSVTDDSSSEQPTSAETETSAEAPSETSAASSDEEPTEAPSETSVGSSDEEPTEAPSETSAASSDEEPTETPTEPVTEEPKLWTPDMGIFNEGKVEYVKEVETSMVEAYPDDKLGQPMQSGELGVLNLFHTDFSDNDPTCDGQASVREAGASECRDGILIAPFDESSATLTGGGWTTWAPNPSASVTAYKQTQLSVDWTVVSAGNGAWLNAMWGCYVSNYTYKIPDAPGDGLWISFNPAGNQIHVYHPDAASWPTAWSAIPVEAGLLNGMHHVDIVTSADYSTYVYVTAEGSSTSRLVCSILFSDGKIRTYNEAGQLVDEADCTTNALQGDHYTLFVHGGGGALIDNLDIYAASKGECMTETTITATPTEGNTLGLDITDKTDLVSICYSVWFDAILGNSGGKVDDWHNITEVLAGQREWGPVPSFHYWAKPALGYYSSSNKEVIRTHMTQLYEAGVDFIVVDLTNANDGYMTNSGLWMSYIQTPMDAICNTIMEMRAEGKGTPYVVFWAGDSEGPLYQGLYDHYHANEAWKDCFVYWDGKPFLLTTHKTEEDFPLKDLYTTRSMWGLGVNYDQGQWSFLSVNNYNRVTNGKDGKPEQVSVAVATQETYMSEPTAHGRNGGIFWYCQWYYAFEVHPKVVGLTWWNEWTAQRYEIQPGKYIFTDNYNQEYSRDIEPMEGGHGDLYYRWLKEYIAHYKAGLDCPVLVEEGYEGRVDRYLNQAKRQS